MKYIQPYDQPSTPNAPYLDLDAAHGVDGSIPPAKFFNNLQAEILAVIQHAGITPSDTDLTQLREAILALIPTPTSAPSDASLVHYAVDSGVGNALAVTPSPGVASVATGLTILCVPAADSTGAATIQVTPSAGAPITKNIRRGDGSALQAGDIKAGRLAAFVYDGAYFRIAWPNYGVTTDGTTIQGDGTVAYPLKSVQSVKAWARVVGGAVVASSGMSSMLQSGALFTFTLASALPDANYAVLVSCSADGGNNAWANEANAGARSTTQFQIRTHTLILGLVSDNVQDFCVIVLK